MKKTFSLFCIAVAVMSCTVNTEPGVSHRLALERAGDISGIEYGLFFDLDASPGEVPATEELSFTSASGRAVVLDFKAPEGSLAEVIANGENVAPTVRDEHIVIPGRNISKGRNTVSIRFTAGEQSLNRRNEFLYTLLVPDRARTLFPCFDQPDLKACYRLSLKVPADWVAVSNTAVASIQEENAPEGSKTYEFAPTEPLSTYLFSFVAGRFKRLEASRDGRTIAMYHRETDEKKLEQSDGIFKLVFDSLDWLEDYTGIPYPFAKYDFIVLPDFQYGGMEHTGATLYNDRSIFLRSEPTTDELLNRASLIAHETAHMWFGDYVTMRWFNDVWTKEVFANWFAAKMIRPQYPSVNHALSDLKSYYASAYEEDRTEGRCAIQRPLDNLKDAGLIYCNTIYDKAPVVMEMLAEKLGPERFRSCIRKYLHDFAYSNATWDDLVAIFDSSTEEDIEEWSRKWIKEAGMPEYTMDSADAGGSVTDGGYWLPNLDGKAYGWFKPDRKSMEYIMASWDGFDETARMSLLMTLYENSWHGTLDRRQFVLWCSQKILSETNPLILSSAISYAAGESLRVEGGVPEFSISLRTLAADVSRDGEARLLAFRRLCSHASTDAQWQELYSIWDTMEPFPGLRIEENDYTGLSYQLMIAMPEKACEIAERQRERITNPDRLEAFDFISRAASADISERQALFGYLLAAPQNRRPESRVLAALRLLCHHSRREEALDYIIPSLEKLPEIQATGDIFFPASWCSVLLGVQIDSPEAARKVRDFLESHRDLNPLLVTKILQAM